MEWAASTLTPPPNVVYPALLKLMHTPRLPAVPTDLNAFVRFGERRNLVSARVPSRSARAITVAVQTFRQCVVPSPSAVKQSNKHSSADTVSHSRIPSELYLLLTREQHITWCRPATHPSVAAITLLLFSPVKLPSKGFCMSRASGESNS